MRRFDPAEFNRLLARAAAATRPSAGGADQNDRTAMELLGMRGDLVGPQRDPACPGAPPRLRGRVPRDMIEAPQPMSCRCASDMRGPSRDTIWRW